MSRTLLAGLFGSFLAISTQAQDPSQFPKPPKEAAWLQHFVGEWDTDGEGVMGPGQPTIKCKGTASAKSLGGYWLVSENKGEVMGMKMTAMFQCGYDAEKKKYVGTWIDSMTNHMWNYEGTVDDSGKKLTLNAKGPSMTDPTKMVNYRDSYEVVSKDHLILRAEAEGPDGKWTQFMKADYKRKK